MKVSLIVPVYNRQSSIDECLVSIQNQTFTDWECILVDDGSTDGSLKKCTEWTEKDHRFKVVSQENCGPSLARQKGLDMAQGEYVLCIDSDDSILPDMVETLVSIVNDNNADTAMCSFYRVIEGQDPFPFDESLPVGCWEGEEVLEKLALPLNSGLSTDKSFIGVLWRILFSKKIIDDNKIKFSPYPVGFPEDMVFVFEYFMCCKKVAVTDKPLYMYKLNTGASTSTSYDSGKWKGVQQGYRVSMEICRKYNLPEYKYKDRVESAFLNSMSVSVKREVQAMKQNGYRKMIGNIKTIIYDEEVKQLFKRPFVKNMSFQMKLFALLSKFHAHHLLVWAIWCYLKLGMEK